MLSQEIRTEFLNYFKRQGHLLMPSSAVIPHDDPTLLFTNAGMNQFKDVFLGKSHRDYKRAATSQKCIRAGGKHNDLENVGHTSRHLTFFEMLGNFSFGDYFKREAIRFAWEIVTSVFKFEPERIWVTVFREDDEAADLWRTHLPAQRIVRMDEADNFWAMGDTGPCGPCSELLYDRGAAFSPARSPLEDKTGERYLEFWNLVFMQFNRQKEGAMQKLPHPSIDTGAGLERVVSLKMGQDSLFETDILRSLIAQVEAVSGKRYNPADAVQAAPFRVIADHIRSLAFAIADGAQPSNVDRGYVLRKILRRAVRYGRALGMHEPFLARILPRLIETMGNPYTELKQAEQRIAEILTAEEEAFIRTLQRGGNLLNEIMTHAQKHAQLISGDDAFRLKDTYGFPIEEILLLAKDAALQVDLDRYQALEEEARQRSRQAHVTTEQKVDEGLFAKHLKEAGSTTFVGYTAEKEESTITGLLLNGQFVSQISAGTEAWVILDKTPFYAEKGGQMGDTGVLQCGTAEFEVVDCREPYPGVIVHVGKLKNGKLALKESVHAKIDTHRRHKIANNHTATHLLNWALHDVLGEHIKQAGSVVEESRLRFDFTHHKALSAAELHQIENLVNAKIRENRPVQTYELSYEEAQKRKEIKQFFGEKYGSRVRVVDAEFSKELCGGIHAKRTGDIGYFRIAKEGSISAGVRRIEAVTGTEAEALTHLAEEQLVKVSNALKTQPQHLSEKLHLLLEESKQLKEQLKQLQKMRLRELIPGLIKECEQHKGFSFLAVKLDVSAEELREISNLLMEQLTAAVVILATAVGDKAHLLIRITPALTKEGFEAHQILRAIAPIIEGSGGGKADSAQAGGKAPEKIAEALQKARELVLQR